jgi:leader peptidase (prepilin peptidase)/N-methyltransferase
MNIITILQNHSYILIIALSVAGLIIGSFLNVVIHRLPLMLEQEEPHTGSLKSKIIEKFNLAIPRSHCPECKNIISWWQNIPLVSYTALKGKCYHCKSSINWRYPLVEALTLAASLVVAINFGFHIKTLPLLILTWALIAAVFIDIETQLLPDQITLPLIWIGLLVNTNYIFTSPQNGIIGAISAYLFLWLIAKLFKIVRKVEGMGYGDFKLFAVFGAWLGWQILPTIILAASLSGLIVGLILIIFKKHNISNPIPFGPYLAIAGWLAFFWQQPLISLIY